MWVLNLKQLLLKPTTSISVVAAFGTILFIVIVRNKEYVANRKLFITFIVIDMICLLLMSTALSWK